MKRHGRGHYELLRKMISSTINYCSFAKSINKLKPRSNRSLFKLIISAIEMNFCRNMCILMGKSLAFFLNIFFYPKVFGLKIQKSTF